MARVHHLGPNENKTRKERARSSVSCLPISIRGEQDFPALENLDHNLGHSPQDRFGPSNKIATGFLHRPFTRGMEQVFLSSDFARIGACDVIPSFSAIVEKSSTSESQGALSNPCSAECLPPLPQARPYQTRFSRPGRKLWELPYRNSLPPSHHFTAVLTPC